MVVKICASEQYPLYSIEETGGVGTPADVPNDIIAEYREASERFYIVQNKLSLIFREAKRLRLMAEADALLARANNPLL